MKKVFFVSIIAALIFTLTNVSAMSESDLRKKFDVEVKVGNGVYSLPAGDKKAVDDYLATHEVSEEDCQYIADRIDKAVEIIEADGHAVFQDFSSSTKKQLKQLVTEIDANTSVKATVTDGSVVILNEDGSTFYEAVKLVKQTGSEINSIAIVASLAVVVVVAGACLVIRQVKKAN